MNERLLLVAHHRTTTLKWQDVQHNMLSAQIWGQKSSPSVSNSSAGSAHVFDAAGTAQVKLCRFGIPAGTAAGTAHTMTRIQLICWLRRSSRKLSES
jgi:hypothetical protein